MVNNSGGLKDCMFSINLDGQRLSGHILFLSQISTSLQKPKVGQINECNFPYQLKDDENDVSQFILSDNRLSINDIAQNNNYILSWLEKFFL